MMSNYSLQVIPKPKEGTRSVLKPNDNFSGPIIIGNSSTNYLCGSCDYILCENVDRGQILNLVFVCPKCGSYNEIKGT